MNKTKVRNGHMIAKNIKYPYIKLLFDVVGIVSFIALLFVFGANFYIEVTLTEILIRVSQ